MKIAIVTDSTSDLPTELIQPYPVYLVPAIVVIEGQAVEDGVDISRREFYERLPVMSNLPTTAAPSSGSFEQLYREILKDGYDRIISIHAPAALSGIYNAARIGGELFGERVTVIDSGQVSMGLGFQVLAGAEALAQGDSWGQLLARIAEIRQRIRLVAMLDTLEYLKRSGRINWARASLGSLLQVKPFIELRESTITSLGEVRTRRKGIARLRQLLIEMGPLERLAVLHTNAESEARQLFEESGVYSPTEAIIINVTTVIGAHVGPQGLGFAGVQHATKAS